MKSRSTTLATLVMLTGLSALAQSDSQKAFDSMKSLAGVWEGKNSMGERVRVSYRLTAGSSALMSEIAPQMQGQSHNMITMIHMDRDRLLLTHYCAVGNQPRMQASSSPDGRTIIFDFVDATNLTSPDAGHMQRVIFTIRDSHHHTEEWHFVDHGKEIVEKFDLDRLS
jgi:hypothetical protein